MTTRRSFLLSGVASCVLALVPSLSRAKEVFAITHSDDEWRNLLTPDQYAILRQSATERPFTSSLLHEKRHGISAVRAAGAICSHPRQNSIAEPVGRVSGHRSMEQLERWMIGLSVWCELPFIAGSAVVISAMSSMTVHVRPGCATASMGSL
jgi:hypothetical protein